MLTYMLAMTEKFTLETMKTTHTPGPWEADVHMGRDGFTIADMIEPSICEMVSSHSPEEVKANAHLIAAAPDLLDALDRLVEDLIEAHADELDNDHHGDGPSCLYCRNIARARAAIAKAGGAQ